MLTQVVQRWNSGKAIYRPAGEVITTKDFEVAAIATDNVAKAFVLANHYSASYPAARFRFGLYRANELMGVAVFSQPVSERSLECIPGEKGNRVELGRFVLADKVPANGETWFLARCFEQLKAEGIVGAISFSDPMPRSTADGKKTFKGHIGTIYQAHNAVYLGRARADTLKLFNDGSVLHNRSLAKVRKLDKGWRYVVENMEKHGAEKYTGGDPATWLASVVPAITRPAKQLVFRRPMRTCGSRGRKSMPVSLPYPKFTPSEGLAAA
jgi:hypothetical protein